MTAALAFPVAAFKANLPNAAPAPSGPKDATAGPWSVAEGVRAPIYAPTVQATPGRFAVADVPQCGVEGEIAFRCRRDLPSRPTPYSRDDVAASIDALAAIEVVTSRYAEPDAAGFLDKLADNVSNGGFVYGATLDGWQRLDLGKLAVTLTVNGAPVLSQIGGHPTGDPLGIAVALVEMMREAGGVREGQYVTCGSCTGLRYLKPGDHCRVDFAGLGTAEVSFVP